MSSAGDEGAPEVVPELLSSALDQLRLDGALFFRSEFTEGFAFQSIPNQMAGALHPGAERIIIFHIVAKGSCWVEAQGGATRHLAREGDVIVVPYGDPHTIGGTQPADVVAVNDLLDPLPWSHLPVIHHGGGGDRVDFVCGYLHSTDPLFDPALRALPSAFVVHPPPGPLAGWVQASIAYALAEGRPSNRSDNPVSVRLPELVLVEVLRAHLASGPSAEHGWIAALRDPVVAPVLGLLHGSPERRWTVTELAAAANVSRSVLDERFRRAVGRSPIRYLTDWRMHLADDLLASSDLGVAAIARRVGYDSEEAFSRAFKRARGQSPANWRVRRREGPPAPEAMPG